MTTITLITSPGDLVRVEVTDDGAATVPMVYQACGEDEDGRGMQLVSALASSLELPPRWEPYYHVV